MSEQTENQQASEADVVREPGTPEPVADKIGADAAASFKAFEAAQEAEAKGEAPPEASEKTTTAEEKPQQAEEKPPEEPPASSGRKQSAGERIRELTRRGKEAERERDAERAEKQALLDRIAALERGEKPATEDAEDQPPNPEDYDFGELDTKYVKDLAKHEARQIVREERARDEQERQQQAAAAQAEEAEHAWADQLEVATQTHPDFVEKVFRGGEAKAYALNRETFEMAKDSDVGAQVLYHLASNPKEALALYRIDDPVERARSFGKLEARFQPGTQPRTAEKPAPTSKAPAPVAQARGNNGQFVTRSDTQDFKAFEAQYQPVLDKSYQ